MMWGFDGFGFGGGGMGVGMLLIWGLVIAAIVVLVRGFGARPGNSDTRVRDSTPLDILRERYARGEIDKNEFGQMRSHISAGRMDERG